MSLKSKRKRFVESRTALSDHEFLSRAGARAEWHIFTLAAREALGRVCQIPADRIYPEDDPELLAELVWAWDDLEVIMQLEELLHIPLDDPQDDFPRFLFGRFFWRKWPGPKTVGEWATRVGEYVHSNQKAQTTK